MSANTSRLSLSLLLAFLVVLVLGVAGVVLLGAAKKPKPGASRSVPPKLIATVTASGQVTLTTPNGQPVTVLPSAWYTVRVRVDSSNVGFCLTGPTVRYASRTHFMGEAIWGVHFIKGTYRYGNACSDSSHATTYLISVD